MIESILDPEVTMFSTISMLNIATNVNPSITMHRSALLITIRVVTVPGGTHQKIALSKEFLLLNVATIAKAHHLTLRRTATQLLTETALHINQNSLNRRTRLPTISQKTDCILPEKFDWNQSM